MIISIVGFIWSPGDKGLLKLHHAAVRGSIAHYRTRNRQAIRKLRVHPVIKSLIISLKSLMLPDENCHVVPSLSVVSRWKKSVYQCQLQDRTVLSAGHISNASINASQPRRVEKKSADRLSALLGDSTTDNYYTVLTRLSGLKIFDGLTQSQWPALVLCCWHGRVRLIDIICAFVNRFV